MKNSNTFSQILNSIQSSHSKQTVTQTLVYPITPLSRVFYQFSILIIACPNLGFNSYSLTFLVPMSDNCRPLSNHTVFFRLHSLPFLTNCILMEMCLLCLVYLPLFSIHTAYLLSNIIRRDCSVTTYVSLLNNSLFIILDYGGAVPAVHTILYSLLTTY